jgi:hypothetical protein
MMELLDEDKEWRKGGWNKGIRVGARAHETRRRSGKELKGIKAERTKGKWTRYAQEIRANKGGRGRNRAKDRGKRNFD